MLKIIYHSSFKRDYKRIKKSNYDISLLNNLIADLANEKTLDAKYLDHPLKGEYYGYRECHIKPDWLLIYKKDSKNLYLSLLRTGSHNDLF